MGSIFRRRDSDASEQWRDGTTEPEAVSPETAEAVTDEATLDWTKAPAGDVPPWRREDRALVDAARAAAAAPVPEDEDAVGLARDLRRLAALSGDAVLTDDEYVAAVRARLAAKPTP